MSEFTPASELETYQVVLNQPEKPLEGIYANISWRLTELREKISEFISEARETDPRVGGNFIPLPPPNLKSDLLSAIDQLMCATFTPATEEGITWVRFWLNDPVTKPLTLVIQYAEHRITLKNVLIVENHLGSLTGENSAKIVIKFAEIVLDNVGFNLLGDNIVLDNPTQERQRRSLFDAFKDPKTWFN